MARFIGMRPTKGGGLSHKVTVILGLFLGRHRENNVRSLYLLTVAAAFAVPCLAHAETGCAVPEGATLHQYSEVPRGVSSALSTTFTSLALQSPLYSQSPAVELNGAKSLTTAQVLFVWQRDNRWVVGFKPGARSSHILVRGFSVQPGGSAMSIMDADFKNHDACAQANALIRA